MFIIKLIEFRILNKIPITTNRKVVWFSKELYFPCPTLWMDMTADECRSFRSAFQPFSQLSSNIMPSFERKAVKKLIDWPEKLSLHINFTFNILSETSLISVHQLQIWLWDVPNEAQFTIESNGSGNSVTRPESNAFSKS